MTVHQEFYCNECDGYFMVPLNMALNINVIVNCPNPDCRHQHRRHIRDGVLKDQHRSGGTVQDILIPRSAYRKEPLHRKSRRYMRDGQVVSDPSRDLVQDRWSEIYGGRL